MVNLGILIPNLLVKLAIKIAENFNAGFFLFFFKHKKRNFLLGQRLNEKKRKLPRIYFQINLNCYQISFDEMLKYN